MKIVELKADERKMLDDWLESRPPHIREIAKRFPPDHLFRHRETKQRVLIVSIDEQTDGKTTVKMFVPAAFNPKRILVEHTVFGVSPDEIEDLPESEREVIEREREEMKGKEAARNAITAALWDEHNLPAIREALGIKVKE